MIVDVITLFPQIFDSLNYGITGRALKNKIIQKKIWNLRDYSDNKHSSVDDKPYGGSPGMVLTYKPFANCINKIQEQYSTPPHVILLTPKGTPLKQNTVQKLTCKKNIILLSGRYEGIDERVMQKFVDEEISIGDYVLSSGDYAALVLIDAICRLMPNALGNKLSIEHESFSESLLDFPHYTRPEIIDNMRVPSVLLQGNHSEILIWQQKQALGQTWLKRPDLLDNLPLTELQATLLAEFIQENSKEI